MKINLTQPQEIVQSRPLMFSIIVFMLVATGAFSLGTTLTNAADTQTPSVALGDMVTLNGSGYQAGEKVSLWTTDPTGAALGASYIFADKAGNIQLQVESSDPQGLAAEAGGNYTIAVTTKDSNGNITAQYLRIILFKPSAGDWTVTGQGNSSGKSNTLPFNLSTSQPAATPPPDSQPSGTISAEPTSGGFGTIFTMNGSGFQPGEKVSLWTTDPSAAAFASGYILADAQGRIQMRVETSNAEKYVVPQNTNYNVAVDTTDSNGQKTQYLRIVLAKPVSGAWTLTSQSGSSKTTQIFSFSITPVINTSISPASGSFGTTFVLSGSGFLPGEYVYISPVDPNGIPSSAGSIKADKNGTVQVHIETADPEGLAAAQGSTYSTLVNILDGNGTIVAQYLRVILYKPMAGNWNVKLFGGTSQITENIGFSLTQ